MRDERAQEIRALLETDPFNERQNIRSAALLQRDDAIRDLLDEREKLLGVVEAYERWTGDPGGWAEMAAAVRAYREASNG